MTGGACASTRVAGFCLCSALGMPSDGGAMCSLRWHLHLFHGGAVAFIIGAVQRVSKKLKKTSRRSHGPRDHQRRCEGERRCCAGDQGDEACVHDREQEQQQKSKGPSYKTNKATERQASEVAQPASTSKNNNNSTRKQTNKLAKPQASEAAQPASTSKGSKNNNNNTTSKHTNKPAKPQASASKHNNISTRKPTNSRPSHKRATGKHEQEQQQQYHEQADRQADQGTSHAQEQRIKATKGQPTAQQASTIENDSNGKRNETNKWTMRDRKKRSSSRVVTARQAGPHLL